MTTAIADRGELVVRERRWPWGARTYVMGIVNVTPDSFSGDGRPESHDAVAHALALLDAGADFIDIGAESTRPGYTAVSSNDEIARLEPVVRGVRAAAPDAMISIDTYKPDVFAVARKAGGDMLNSIWGLEGELLETAIAAGVPVVIMHNKSEAVYPDGVVEETLSYLAGAGARAVRAGIAAERVILDPGIGFGKTPEQNIEILAALDRFVALGFPTLVGTSRKSPLGRLTGRPVTQRTYATAATVALAAAAKIDIVRVHDVEPMRDVVTVADAIVRGVRPAGWPKDA
ncbi:MAG: dihydropteroate synthase [Candidatus Eremiobacteraeota bacterium]|nr:dihydropteroate synthase [Candidatus Eremiobacteraeota bacterium]